MSKTLFINRNFTCLWIGKIISQIGDDFYAIALSWWILQNTNSPGIMGFFLLTSVLPGLFFGFYAGAVVDRQNRKNIMIITDILRGLLIFVIFILSYMELLKVWQVFVIGGILSFITSFFDPAAQAIIPQLVDKTELPKANSLNQMITGVCSVLGPVLGAATVSLFGVSTVFLLNGLSYLISAFFEKMVRYKVPGISDTKQTIFQDMKEGIAFLKGKKEILRIITIIAAAHFFLGSLMVVFPFLANKLHGVGVKNLGYIETMLGVGFLIGALFISKRKVKAMKELYLIFMIMFIGICFTAIGVLQFTAFLSIMPYLLIFLLIGSTISIASIFWQSLLQYQTPEYMTGRVFGIATLAGNVSSPIAYGLFGILLDYSEIWSIMFACGGSLILLSLTLLISLKSFRLRKK